MRTVAIIQARMGSTRLPGKCMADLAGKPVLEWVVRAVSTSCETWVATSDATTDDEIAKWCFERGVYCFRGPEIDVLGRYDRCAHVAAADEIVRITADCPFLDPAAIGLTIATRHKRYAEYVINRPGWPDGMDVEVFTRLVLRRAVRDIHDQERREHVGPAILAVCSAASTMFHLDGPDPIREVKLSIDTADDLAFCRRIAAQLPDDRPPTWQEVHAAVSGIKAAA